MQGPADALLQEKEQPPRYAGRVEETTGQSLESKAFSGVSFRCHRVQDSFHFLHVTDEETEAQEMGQWASPAQPGG